MGKWIYNNDSVTHKYVGQEISSDAYYEIQISEDADFMRDTSLEDDITSALVIMSTTNDESGHIGTITDQVNFLKTKQLQSIELVNPPDDVYFSLVNTIRDVFNNDYENVLMCNYIKNAKVVFFVSSAEVESITNCQFQDGDLELSTASDIQKDDCDSISGYSEDNNKDENTGDFSLNTNSDYYKEGTGSIDLNIDSSNGKEYAITKTITSEDWSSYNAVKLWIHSAHDDSNKPEVAFYFKNGSDWNETILTPLCNGMNDIVLSISSFTRDDVVEYGFFIKQNDNNDFHVYIDDIRLGGTTYEISGNIETSTDIFDSDIAKLFLLEKISDMPEECSRTVKISLDGTNWHTITDNDFENWISVSGWSET